METLAQALILVGAIPSVLGFIALVGLVEQESPAYRYIAMFFPILFLFWVLQNWEEGKQPFFMMLIGALILATGVVLYLDLSAAPA